MRGSKQTSRTGKFASVTFPPLVSETSGTLSLLGFHNSYFFIVESGDGQREEGAGSGRRGAKQGKMGTYAIVSAIKIKKKFVTHFKSSEKSHRNLFSFPLILQQEMLLLGKYIYIKKTKLMLRKTSGLDGGVGRHTVPPHTTKGTTTNLKTKNNQN